MQQLGADNEPFLLLFYTIKCYFSVQWSVTVPYSFPLLLHFKTLHNTWRSSVCRGILSWICWNTMYYVQQLLGAAVGCGSRLPHEYHGSSEICIGVQKIPLNYFDCRIWKLFHSHAMAFFIHHLLHCTCVCAWLIFSLTLYWILCDVLTIHFVGSLNHIHHVWLVWFIHTRHVLVDHGYIITIYICTQNWVWFLEGLLGYFIL